MNKVDIKFITIPRQGDDYASTKIKNVKFPSATSIRRLWHENTTENIEEYIPAEAINIYTKAIKDGNITDITRFDAVLLTFFRTHIGSDFNDIVGASGGLANRICEMAHKARSADELLELVRTKRYTK